MLRLTIGIIVGVMLASVACAQSRLPPCPPVGSSTWTNCFGTLIWWAEGAQYVGEFKDGKRNGQGTNIGASGSKYVGQWQDNKRTGQGIMYAANGSILQSGGWLNNQFVEPVATRPSTPVPSGHNEIALVKDSGTFKIPVLINGVIMLHFTVDSGAADVSVPADVVMTLMRTGTIQPDDFIGTKTYRLADGSTVPSRTFRIRSLKVGDKVIENVTGSMANVEGSLLLGQSFLSRFGRVSFDYNRQLLVLE